MTEVTTMTKEETAPPELAKKLWLYTNYDCHLQCSYCCAESGPRVPRRELGLENANRLVDEAVTLGFEEAFFTGGETFLLKEIYPMLAYSSERLKTTVLTSGMLLRGKRMENLAAISNKNLVVQVSLDGGSAEEHDAYRGCGTWQKTIDGIRRLLDVGFKVRISTTRTPANMGTMDETCAFHQSLGISEEDHFIRPMAMSGVSEEGVEVSMETVQPEITVSADGVFWHPICTEERFQVSKDIFPLSAKVEKIKCALKEIAETGKAPEMTFT
jgi:MoaA/NifB/PqqE/SkfB family radical SAM enzyme